MNRIEKQGIYDHLVQIVHDYEKAHKSDREIADETGKELYNFCLELSNRFDDLCAYSYEDNSKPITCN